MTVVVWREVNGGAHLAVRRSLDRQPPERLRYGEAKSIWRQMNRMNRMNRSAKGMVI